MPIGMFGVKAGPAHACIVSLIIFLNAPIVEALQEVLGNDMKKKSRNCVIVTTTSTVR